MGSPYRASTNFGGIVPLNVHTRNAFWVGMFGWNFSAMGSLAKMPEFKLDGTLGLYVRLVVAPICVASTATRGKNSLNRWCAHIGPGGRPSMGPCPPPSAGSTACIVWLASSMGAGFRNCLLYTSPSPRDG